MKDVYFDLLKETKINEYIFSNIIKNYCKINDINANTNQIFILHLLIKEHNGACQVICIEDEMSYISPNQLYNIERLIRDGYITRKRGKEVNQDGRCRFIFATDKGLKLYSDICDYVRDKVKKFEQIINWDFERFDRYLEDSRTLHYMGSR